MDGGPRPDLAAQHQIAPAVFEERMGENVLRVTPDAIARQRRSHLFRELRPDQLLGKVGRRRDQHQAREPIGLAQSRQRACEQERDPTAHGRADHDLWPIGQCAKNFDGLLRPSADGPVFEIAVGFAMAGIVEAQA